MVAVVTTPSKNQTEIRVIPAGLYLQDTPLKVPFPLTKLGENNINYRNYMRLVVGNNVEPYTAYRQVFGKEARQFHPYWKEDIVEFCQSQIISGRPAVMAPGNCAGSYNGTQLSLYNDLGFCVARVIQVVEIMLMGQPLLNIVNLKGE